MDSRDIASIAQGLTAGYQEGMAIKRQRRAMDEEDRAIRKRDELAAIDPASFQRTGPSGTAYLDEGALRGAIADVHGRYGDVEGMLDQRGKAATWGAEQRARYLADIDAAWQVGDEEGVRQGVENMTAAFPNGYIVPRDQISIDPKTGRITGVPHHMDGSGPVAGAKPFTLDLTKAHRESIAALNPQRYGELRWAEDTQKRHLAALAARGGGAEPVFKLRQMNIAGGKGKGPTMQVRETARGLEVIDAKTQRPRLATAEEVQAFGLGPEGAAGPGPREARALAIAGKQSLSGMDDVSAAYDAQTALITRAREDDEAEMHFRRNQTLPPVQAMQEVLSERLVNPAATPEDFIESGYDPQAVERAFLTHLPALSRG